VFFADLLVGGVRRTSNAGLAQIGKRDLDRTLVTTEDRIEGNP
jgi:hypothetical protein